MAVNQKIARACSESTDRRRIARGPFIGTDEAHIALPGEESMNAITVNTFPGVNSFTSARSWVLALIVLLHVGFFWALSNGLSIGSFVEMPRRTVIDNLPVPSKPTPPARVIDDVPIRHAYTPRPAQPRPQFEEEKGTSIEQVVDAPPLVERGPAVAPTPVVVEPEVDPRTGLSEPLYPSQEIRMGHAGAVVLLVEVLPNGRVGEVRLHQSSGFPRLDDSAIREARRWRLRPGARDGVPTTMWKEIPVTFRLQDAVKF
jgi:periplasmic protein TonB